MLEKIPFKLVQESGYAPGGGVMIVVVYEPGSSTLYLLNFSGECVLVGVPHGRGILDRWSDQGSICCCLCLVSLWLCLWWYGCGLSTEDPGRWLHQDTFHSLQLPAGVRAGYMMFEVAVSCSRSG